MSQQLDPCNAYHTDEQRWAAVLARDAAADGAFVYAVKTTGVYCRPSSSARRPRRENVEFFATAEAAEAAGYRPSRRAAGDRSLAAEQRAERVAQACRMIETAETPPALEALAARLGMSPFHFHRLFKAETGLTPKAYASAYRARRLRERLGQASASVTEAIYDSGFNSNSRFYESSSQRLGMRPRDYRDGGAGAAIRFAIGQCSLGAILVAQSQRGICAILLGEEPEPLLRELQDQFPRAQLLARRRLRTAGGAGGGLRRVASTGTGPAAGRTRYGVPGTGLAGTAGNTAGQHGELCADRRTDRRAASGACGGPGLRGEPDRGGDSLPPSGTSRRRHFRLPLGRGAQARTAAQGRAGLNPRPGDTRPGMQKAHSMVGSMQWGAGPSAGSSIHVRGENFVK